MRRHGHTIAITAVVAASLAAALTGCMPESSAPSSATSPAVAPLPTATATPSATPTPTPGSIARPDGAVALPTDCRAMLNDTVLAALEPTPLNAPAFGPSGVLDDGTLVCIWADPAADTTALTTTISYVVEWETIDMLNALVADDGFTCYQPDAGVRCEKTWDNATYPVTDGRTLYYRDNVLIDTQYSNLAPSGYTDAIVAAVFG